MSIQFESPYTQLPEQIQSVDTVAFQVESNPQAEQQTISGGELSVSVVAAGFLVGSLLARRSILQRTGAKSLKQAYWDKVNSLYDLDQTPGKSITPDDAQQTPFHVELQRQTFEN